MIYVRLNEEKFNSSIYILSYDGFHCEHNLDYCRKIVVQTVEHYKLMNKCSLLRRICVHSSV